MLLKDTSPSLAAFGFGAVSRPRKTGEPGHVISSYSSERQEIGHFMKRLQCEYLRILEPSTSQIQRCGPCSMLSPNRPSSALRMVSSSRFRSRWSLDMPWQSGPRPRIRERSGSCAPSPVGSVGSGSRSSGGARTVKASQLVVAIRLEAIAADGWRPLLDAIR